MNPSSFRYDECNAIAFYCMGGQMMERLLTSRQVQEILCVDRTTIYRMLKDGRLTGIRVGTQWRFSPAEVQNLLSASPIEHAAPEPDAGEVLPWFSLQPAQDVFAEMAEIGSVITDNMGLPLTHISNSCEFCNLILESRKGRSACFKSWRSLASQDGAAPEFTACHAGLQYARAPITVSGEPMAYLVGGQFYAAQPDAEESQQRMDALAQKYHIDADKLTHAAASIRVLDGRLVGQISTWLSRVAHTFEQISTERAEMLSRLHQIEEMSRLAPPNPEPRGFKSGFSITRSHHS
jgi:excisionase family DNA binding protein